MLRNLPCTTTYEVLNSSWTPFGTMKRFLLVPAAALAVFSFAAPASAQPVDIRTQILDVRRDATRNGIAVTRIQHVLNGCETPDANVIAALQDEANEISRRAGGIAWVVGGQDHVLALGAQSTAENSYWTLANLQTPAMCYQPPAE